MTTVNDVNQPPGDDWIRVSELRPLLAALPALRDGDFRVRLPADRDGIAADLARAFNQIADRDEHFANELSRVTREVVRHGRLDERLSPGPGQSAWTASVESARSVRRDAWAGARRYAACPVAGANADLRAAAGRQRAGEPVR